MGGVQHEREKAEPDGTAQVNAFAVVEVEPMVLDRVTQAVRETGGRAPIRLLSHEQEFIAPPNGSECPIGGRRERESLSS